MLYYSRINIKRGNFMKKRIISILLMLTICLSIVQIFSEPKYDCHDYNFLRFSNKIAESTFKTDNLQISSENENSKFYLKRLIVMGKIDETYGATEVISGYRDFSILCYETESDTENAYNNLKKNIFTNKWRKK